MRFRRGLGVSELLRTKEAKAFTATWHSMALAHRLCRLPRLLPLAAAAAASKPYLPGNPSPALPPPLSSPSPPPPPPFPSLSRLFSTTPSSSSGDSSMVVVGSAESFTSIMSKVEAEKLPAVFYYTAVWCGPCRAMAPVISKLSSRYPKIPIYKVDIDMDGVGSKLSDLKIFSVPTFHFYYQGRKTGEVATIEVVEEYDREVARCLHVPSINVFDIDISEPSGCFLSC
uniref:Thioredoxin domain-containing protein n=2 Tax=Oryza meridionalis TaxID=40149 RepID=A0A0E0E4Y5_9ORYZ